MTISHTKFNYFNKKHVSTSDLGSKMILKIYSLLLCITSEIKLFNYQKIIFEFCIYRIPFINEMNIEI